MPEDKFIAKNFLLALILCVCFMACSLFFVFYMVMKNEQESISHLRNLARQSVTALLRQVQGDLQTLKGVAVCIGDADITDPALINRILKTINDGNTFIRMGLADVRGNVELLDIDGRMHSGVNLASEPFFQQALKGDIVVSRTVRDPLGDGLVNYLAVPVKRDGEVVGVLCAVNDAAIFRTIIDGPVFNSRGFAAIIDSRGFFVIRTDHPDLPADVRNLDGMGLLAPEEQKRVHGLLSEGKPAIFKYSSADKKHMAVVEPLDGVNDWYVLSTVPQDVIKARYWKTALGTMGIIAAAFGIFLFFLFRLSRISTRNRAMLECLAYTDPLTGSRNYQKLLLDGEAFIASAGGRRFAVWYSDIKKFKYLNDILGYQAGDAILRKLAGLLEKDAGDSSLFCRVSADNFAGIRFYQEKSELVSWFQSLPRELSAEKMDTGDRLHIEMSMGFYCPEDAGKAGKAVECLPLNDMINRANMAQKAAKQREGSRYAFFTSRIREQNLKETEMESAMESALEQGEFELYLQPKVNIRNGDRIGGAEVLARWRSREKGFLSPGEFIPLFEKNGFIVQLDRYMFEQICKWLRGYLDEGRPPLNIAINVSRLGLVQEHFVEYYAAIKEKYAIPDRMLELEFTESLILDDSEEFRSVVLQLQDKGFICSLDDFGAGYSSLNVLKNLPIDVLKLDILFFRGGVDIRRERIVISNVIAMARELNIKTIAEGVETLEQVEFLRGTGCDLVQGYVFARPMPLPDFDRLLRELDGGPLAGRDA